MATHPDETERLEREHEIAGKRADQAAIEVIHAVLPRVTLLATKLSHARDQLAHACDEHGGWYEFGAGKRATELRLAGETTDAVIEGLKSVMVMINASLEDE